MKAVLFVDHAIGARLLDAALADARLEILAVVTTESNASGWWPAIAPLLKGRTVPLHLYTPQSAGFLKEYAQADLFFLLSWKYPMPEWALCIPKHGAVNLHYSLLPAYRGVYPVNWALIDGARETGVTFHLAQVALDAGPVLCSRKVSIAPEDTASSLLARLDDAALALFAELLELLLRNGAAAPLGTPQPSDAEYYSRERFEQSNALDVEQTVKVGDFINLLRGKSFLPHARHLYMRDPDTGEKIYLSLVLERD